MLTLRPDRSQIYTTTPGQEILVPPGGTSALYNSLIAFWPLNEASGIRADAFGVETLTDINTVTSTTGHVYALAGLFTATNSEYLARNDNAALSTGDISFWVAAWAYVNSGSGASMVVIARNATSTNREYRLFLNRNSSNNFSPIMLVMNNGVSNAQAVWGSNMGVNGFHFIIGWHDSVNNLVGVSVDGGTPVTTSYSGGAADSTSNLTIGRLDEGGTLYMNGRIGPAMFGKNYVPTLSDIAFLYNAGAGRTFAAMVGQ